jgi:hypothetical protein
MCSHRDIGIGEAHEDTWKRSVSFSQFSCELKILKNKIYYNMRAQSTVWY